MSGTHSSRSSVSVQQPQQSTVSAPVFSFMRSAAGIKSVSASSSRAAPDEHLQAGII